MTTEDYVRRYGEKYRELIVDAVRFLDASAPGWGLDTPVDRNEYIHELIQKAERGEG